MREQIIQKYGKPVLETSNTAFLLHDQESQLFQHQLCWGGCKIQSSESDKNILDVKDQALIIGLDVDKSVVNIIWMLVDETAITAAQKNTSQTEAEKAAAKVNL